MTGKQADPAAGQSITGISLASFVQLLEQERKSCTLVVTHSSEQGKLYFSDGNVIDAECSGKVGLEAAYAILAWENPSFFLSESENRMVRISQPLTHLLLKASTWNDEEKYQQNSKKPQKPPPSPMVSPALAQVIEKLKAIPGVQHYYILNKQGKLITQSDSNTKMADFIAYCIVSGQQMKEVLEAKGLHNIRIRLNEDRLLLIIPVSGVTIALMLAQDSSIGDIFNHLRTILAKKK